jgi:hypothetical protein
MCALLISPVLRFVSLLYTRAQRVLKKKLPSYYSVFADVTGKTV